jgi:cell division septation protein DedD
MKYIIVFIHALAIAIYQLLFGDPVTVVAKVPDNISAGKDFVVEVVVNKAQIAGFAKLQLELPEGFVASEVDSKGGSFTASGTIVKIIWTSVPSDPEVTVKINITVPASAAGDKQLQGKFSYIENNVKQQAELSPVTIKLGGSDNTASVTSSDTTAAKPDATQTTTGIDTAKTFAKSNELDAIVSAARKITSLGSPDNFQVDITIKKGNIKGFAKFSEKIPAGYKAESINTSGASFDFEGGEAKFIWTSIPANEEINVSYKLTPDPSTSIQKPANIESGSFSYIENDQTKKATIDNQEITDANATALTTPSNTETTQTTAATTNTLPNNTNTVADNTDAATTTTAATENTITTTGSVPPAGNVHYSVQIGAFKNGVNVSSLKKKYALNDNVKTEMHEGLTKCILGKYNEYKIARDSRETVKQKGVEGAFVTAYNSGKRITVQEALMVSNQKWYK